MTVSHPEARVVGHESNNRVALQRHSNCVLDDGSNKISLQLASLVHLSYLLFGHTIIRVPFEQFGNLKLEIYIGILKAFNIFNKKFSFLLFQSIKLQNYDRANETDALRIHARHRRQSFRLGRPA